MSNATDAIDFKTEVVIEHRQKGVLVDSQVRENVILNQGKAEVIKMLSQGIGRTIARMAIGDRGALPSNTQVPRVPSASGTALFHEVYRTNIQTTQRVTDGAKNELMFICTFEALAIDKAGFLDKVDPRVNEVGLVLCDLIAGAPMPRDPVVAGIDTPPADEIIFSHLPFKSIPFTEEDETSITIRYRIYVA